MPHGTVKRVDCMVCEQYNSKALRAKSTLLTERGNLGLRLSSVECPGLQVVIGGISATTNVMRFQVPQFIEIETKIIGPFTLKQFLFLATGAVIVFILQYLLSLTFLIVVGLPIAFLALALAFYKVDGMPLPQYFLRALSYLTGTKRYQFTKNEKLPLPK